MIEYDGKKYYTPVEILDLIEDGTSDLSKVWKKHFPNYKNVVLLDQINRVLQTARHERKINYMKFKKSPKSEKLFYAFTEKDVIEYLENTKKEFDICINEKEKK